MMKKETINTLGMGCIMSMLWVACTTKEPVIKLPPSAATERIIMDTAYGANAQQKMDIYLPKGRSASTKTIVLIHGGAWQAGDKSEMNQFVSLLQKKWPECAIVNINYRLANGSSIAANQIMADVKQALQLVVDNHASFSVSTDFGMLGASAGAQLALLYTYTQNTNNYVKCVADLYGPCIIDDWSWYNSFNIFLGKPIKDILTTYTGSTWEADSNVYHQNSPYRQLTTSNQKPTIVFHGDADVIVPVYQSQWLVGKLKSLAVPHEYHEYKFDGHGFNASNNVDCIDKTVTFFKKHL